MENSLLKEINLNKTRTDATFNIKCIGNNKIKHSTLLYNLNKIINNSDISYINYTEGGIQSNKPLESLNTIFCDNILLYYPIDDTLIKNIDKYINKKEEDIEEKEIEEIEEEEDKKVPTEIEKAAKEILAATTATTKMVLNKLDINITKPDIKPIAIKKTDNFVHKPSKFVQLLKVNLSNVDIDNVFALLEDQDKRDFMRENKLFIHDIDFTRDYKGVFNKKDVIKHLTENHNFVKEGNANPNNNPIIKKNSAYVSNNCLTFLRPTSLGTIRYKFYNKFVQSMESPSVRNKIGSHINDWINNPEPILKKAIENSLETGLLRLEYTIYRYNMDNYITKNDVIEQMDYLENLMPPNLIYYNSIQNQFNLICNNILYNTCLIDVETNTAFVCLYHNKLTGKANGFYLEKIDSRKLSNALRYFCSNKPIVVVLMRIDSVNKEVNIQQDTYLRIAPQNETLYTYLPTGSEKLKIAQTKPDYNKPEQMGLVPNEVFNFQYAPTSCSLLKSVRNVKDGILFKQFPLGLLSYPNNNITIRSVNKEIREIVAEEDFNLHFANKIKLIKEKNEEIEEDVKEELKKEVIRNKLYKVLSNTRAYTYKFVDLPDKTDIYVYGCKKTNTRYGDTYLLACSKENCIRDTTEIELYWSTNNITNYINKVIANNNFKQMDINGITAYGSLSGVALLNLCKEKNCYTDGKHLYAKVIIKQCKSNAKEDITIDTTNLLKEIDANIKDCKKIDEFVKTGDVVKISGFKKLKASVLIEASINDGETKNYIATYWLKELIITKLGGKDTTTTITVIAGAYKTTPQKQKAIVYTA